MSAKAMNRYQRWRSKTIAFRMSPEEDLQLEFAVALSGLTKQDYIIQCLLNHEVVVHGNSRILKAVREQTALLLEELQRIDAGTALDPELQERVGRLLEVVEEKRN